MGYQGFKGCHCVSYDGMDLFSVASKIVIVMNQQIYKMVINIILEYDHTEFSCGANTTYLQGDFHVPAGELTTMHKMLLGI